MLAYHKAIQADLQDGDSLVVLSRGLGMVHAFVAQVISSLSSPGLVLGLNISRPVASQVIFPLLHAQQHLLPSGLCPQFISADYSAKDRAALYATGGFLVVTANIAVHDLLQGTLSAQRVSGVAVFAADSVRQDSNEALALKLFRASSGWVHAFYEAAPGLARGFHSAEKLMRALGVSKLSLWPRFHTTVKQALSRAPDLVDLRVDPTPRLAAIVRALRDCATAVLGDERRATPEIDFALVFRDEAQKELAHNFDMAVRRQLEGAEVRVTGRVYSLIADLKVLRMLLRDAFELNAVAFYQLVSTVRQAAERGSSWLVRKEAQRLIFLARSRVWVKGKGEGMGGNVDSGGTKTAILEESPKWEALASVLNEIQADVRELGENVGRVFVAVKGKRMAEELKEVLEGGGRAFLERRFMETFEKVALEVKQSESGEGNEMQQVTLTQMAQPERPRPVRQSAKEDSKSMRSNRKTRAEANGSGWRGEESIEEMNEMFRLVETDKPKIEVLIWGMEWVDFQGRGHHILEEFAPSFVVLYNADVSFIRQVEVYKACHPGCPVRMYILAYDEASDEEQFRGASRRENASFKTLIRERATMSVHMDQVAQRKDEEFTQSMLAQTSGAYSNRGLSNDRDSRLNQTMGPIESAEGAKMLVDTRELRSALPMLLYQTKINVVPLTLEVGDFVLSPSIGIERKSVADLYGSFGSGRLFNQAEALCRHYKNACLLIEMDSAKSLSLSRTAGGVPSEIRATFILSKMVLLFQQFPNLHLLWAKGAHDAAEMFCALRANDEAPDEAVAVKLGVDTEESDETLFNSGPQALLRSLPGIDSSNLRRVMRKVRNVSTLLTMTKAEMTDTLGSAACAARLFEFINEQPSEAMAML